LAAARARCSWSTCPVANQPRPHAYDAAAWNIYDVASRRAAAASACCYAMTTSTKQAAGLYASTMRPPCGKKEAPPRSTGAAQRPPIDVPRLLWSGAIDQPPTFRRAHDGRARRAHSRWWWDGAIDYYRQCGTFPIIRLNRNARIRLMARPARRHREPDQRLRCAANR
jgi:hypothetical protein